jgi:hypothetical protein
MNKLFETRKHLAATKIQARWRGGCGRNASARQYAALAERARLAQQFDVLIQQVKTACAELFETRKYLAATKIQARWRGGYGRTASARQYAALAERARLAQQFDVLIQQASAHRISYYMDMDHR